MRRALGCAARGRGRTTPNPLVGAVVVGRRRHGRRRGLARAGRRAARRGPRARRGGRAARGATLFCTLEPCCHTGRTGPCTERDHRAGIVASWSRPSRIRTRSWRAAASRCCVRTASRSRSASSARRAAAERRVLHVMRERRPVRDPQGGDEPRRADRRGARRADAAHVGGACGTRSTSGRRWTRSPSGRDRARRRSAADARDVYRERPLTRVMFDRRLRTPPSARLFTTRDDGPVVILTMLDASADSGRGGRRPAAAQARASSRWSDALDGGGDAGARRPWRDIGAGRGRGGLQRGGLGRRYGRSTCSCTWRRTALGPGACRCSTGALCRPPALCDRRSNRCGDDVLIEGDVHRPH